MFAVNDRYSHWFSSHDSYTLITGKKNHDARDVTKLPTATSALLCNYSQRCCCVRCMCMLSENESIKTGRRSTNNVIQTQNRGAE